MRIQSIDYLRGLMSLSIVFYHFTTSFTGWGQNDSGAILGRLGVYAVSAFYIISGMALYLAHKNDCWSVKGYFIFVARRFLRLAPVYWLALLVFTVFAYQYWGGFSIDVWKYTQNILLIFGLTNPTEYLIMGGWSIGNEIVFYLFFPALILMTRNKYLLFLLLLLSLGLFGYCTVSYLDATKGIAEQWSEYIRPINQIYFFMFGIVVAKFLLPQVGRNKVSLSILIALSFVAFILYPVTGNQINIITGVNKVFFTAITLFVCVLFFLVGDYESIKPLHVIFKFLGNVSYPLYLLHGVSFSYFQKLVFYKGISDSELLGYGFVLLVILLITSWLCHVGIEKPIVRFSKRLKITKKPTSQLI